MKHENEQSQLASEHPKSQKKVWTQPALALLDMEDTNSSSGSGTDGGLATTVGGPSDRAIKNNFSPVDEQEILRKVAGLPIEMWNYTDREQGVRHIGPMAQDFMASFNVGASDKVINMVDANGVNLAAIKALNAKLEEKETQIQLLQEQLAEVMRRLEKLT
jgi:hypothetical protein